MTSPDVKFFPPKNNLGSYTWEIEYALSKDYLVCTQHSPKNQYYRFSITLQPMLNDCSYFVECKEFLFLYWKRRFQINTKSYDLIKATNEALVQFDNYLMSEKPTQLPLGYFETSMFLKMEVSGIMGKMLTFPSIQSYIGKIINPKENSLVKKSKLTEFQEAQLFKFVDDVAALDIFHKRDSISDIAIKKSISEIINRILRLRNVYGEQSGWVLLSGKLFESVNYKEAIEIIDLLEPIEKLAIKYLKTIVANYDELMTDVGRAKHLFSESKKFADSGGHISQNREFIREWSKTIGSQWFGIAHFIYDIQYTRNSIEY